MMTVTSSVDSPGSPAAMVSWRVGRLGTLPTSQKAAEGHLRAVASRAPAAAPSLGGQRRPSSQPGSQPSLGSQLGWLLPHLQQQRGTEVPARQPIDSDRAGRVEAPTAVQPVPCNALKQLLALGQAAPGFQHSGAASAFQRPQPNPAPHRSAVANQAQPASQPAGKTAVQLSQQGGAERSAAKRVTAPAPELSSGRVSAPMPVSTPPAAGPSNGTRVTASKQSSVGGKRGRGEGTATSPPPSATRQAPPATTAGASIAAKRQRVAPGAGRPEPAAQQRPASVVGAKARREPLLSAMAVLSQLQLAWAWRTYVAHYDRRQQGFSSQLPPAALAVLAARMVSNSRAS